MELVDMREGRCHFEIFFYGPFKDLAMGIYVVWFTAIDLLGNGKIKNILRPLFK